MSCEKNHTAEEYLSDLKTQGAPMDWAVSFLVALLEGEHPLESGLPISTLIKEFRNVEDISIWQALYFKTTLITSQNLMWMSEELLESLKKQYKDAWFKDPENHENLSEQDDVLRKFEDSWLQNAEEFIRKRTLRSCAFYHRDILLGVFLEAAIEKFSGTNSFVDLIRLHNYFFTTNYPNKQSCALYMNLLSRSPEDLEELKSKLSSLPCELDDSIIEEFFLYRLSLKEPKVVDREAIQKELEGFDVRAIQSEISKLPSPSAEDLLGCLYGFAASRAHSDAWTDATLRFSEKKCEGIILALQKFFEGDLSNIIIECFQKFCVRLQQEKSIQFYVNVMFFPGSSSMAPQLSGGCRGRDEMDPVIEIVNARYMVVCFLKIILGQVWIELSPESKSNVEKNIRESLEKLPAVYEETREGFLEVFEELQSEDEAEPSEQETAFKGPGTGHSP